MRLFGSDRMMGLMDTLGMEEGQVIEHPWVSRAIEIAQKRVETHNFEIRKQLLEYDNVMNRQREVIYAMRRSILEGEDIKERILDALDASIKDMVAQYFSGQQDQSEIDLEGFKAALASTFGFDVAPFEQDLPQMAQAQVEDLLYEKLSELYEAREKIVDPQAIRGLERMVLLQTIDTKWKDHLYAMDQLKEGIGLRAFAHRDPLVEYQREAFGMFESMYHSIMQEVVETVFKVEPVAEPRKVKSVFSSLPQQLIHTEHSSLSGAAAPSAPHAMPEGGRPSPSAQPQKRAMDKVGRNDPCPCGSGKKYKKCCGANAA